MDIKGQHEGSRVMKMSCLLTLSMSVSTPLYYSFARCCHWGKLDKQCMRFVPINLQISQNKICKFKKEGSEDGRGMAAKQGKKGKIDQKRFLVFKAYHSTCAVFLSFFVSKYLSIIHLS